MNHQGNPKNKRTSTFNCNRDMSQILACAIKARDEFTCVYCKTKLTMKGDCPATLDHIIPRSRGGKAERTNLVTSCAPCNRKKGKDMPEDFSVFRAHIWAYRPIDIVKGRELAMKHYPSRFNRRGKKNVEVRA